MTYLAKPKFRHPSLEKNERGFTRRDYEGSISTLCAGCGHDSISAALIQAFFELNIEPHRVAKMSGIGCSSKTPDYFLGQSHGFNSVHGRMPSVLTGANLANKNLIYLGVSGDGDSASIGLGQFVHCVRRGVNMTYITENNGVYGLTKGQFSATADRGSKSKAGGTNSDSPIDLVSMAMLAGATFVGRSFSGDKTPLVPLIKAALSHNGPAFIDVISPCVAFNNHAGSTKSFDFVRDHNDAVNRLDFFEGRAEITADYKPGTVQDVEQHDGSVIRLHKIADGYDPTNKVAAMNYLATHHEKGELVTGLLYLDPNPKDMHQYLRTVDVPLNRLNAKELCPGSKMLDTINDELGGTDGPDGCSLHRVSCAIGPSESRASPFLDVDAEMTLVPSVHRLRILGLEEHSANSSNSLHVDLDCGLTIPVEFCGLTFELSRPRRQAA